MGPERRQSHVTWINLSILSTALELHMAVAVLRVQEGFDYTGIIADFDWTNPSGLGVDNKSFAKTNDDTTADQLTFSKSRANQYANEPTVEGFRYRQQRQFEDNGHRCDT